MGAVRGKQRVRVRPSDRPAGPRRDVPGTITLAMRRHRAPVGEAREAVIALAGGPGQAAIPFTEDFAQLLGPILATRDLIVFDQRGIGLSGALSCHRFELAAGGPGGPEIAECAGQLGASRSYYTTAQTVADIEAIRQAGGYEKLVLYGTSYGTKVAERYAQTYPNHVSALVLDSVVPPNGPEPLDRPTFAAVPRVLRQLCAARACARITPEPVADLAKVVKRIGAGALHARWIDERGRAHTISITAERAAADPGCRRPRTGPARRVPGGGARGRRGRHGSARAPRARGRRNGRGQRRRKSGRELRHAAVPGDHLRRAAVSLEPGLLAGAAAARSKRAARLAARARVGAVRPGQRVRDQRPAGMRLLALSRPPPRRRVQAPFPSVPTLILSGADDLRTPTANAREVASQIPGSHLLVVPEVGHSVLGTDLSGCASRALQALFKPAPIQPCRRGRQLLNLLGLTALAPARLSDVSPARGFHGKIGRTLHALSLTVADFERQAEVRGLSELESGAFAELGSVRIGGLRAGWADAGGEKLTLHGYSYVPGVTVTGTIGARETSLRLGGWAAAQGSLRLVSRGQLTGTLGDQGVQIPARATLPDAIVAVDAQAALKLAPGGRAARAAAGRLAGLVQRISELRPL